MSKTVVNLNGGIGVIGLLQVAFIVMKLLGLLSWSWLAVLTFWLWASVLVFFAIMAIMLCVLGVLLIYAAIFDK